MITLGEKAEQALRVVREAKLLAYDTETSGLDWKIHNPVGYVITTEDFNAYIPVRHGGGGNLLDPHCGPLKSPTDETRRHSFEEALAKAFEARRLGGFLTIGHNLGFDMHMSANQGVLLGRNCGCTQINAAMLDEYNFGGFSLDAVARGEGVTPKQGDQLYQYMSRLLGLPAEKKIMEHFWQTEGSAPEVIDYSCGDGTSTLEVWHKQIKSIEEQDMSYIHAIESKLLWTVFRVERRGMKVDVERLEEIIGQVAARLVIARQQLPDSFNERSPKDVRAVCEAVGETGWPMTEPSKTFPDGQPSFNEKFLKTFPKGKAILEVRKLSNLSNSFIVPLRDTHMFKGRIHTTLNQLKSDEFGTISGRFSSSRPNMQQVPKRDKDLGRLFRSIFVPDSGMDIWEGDYSQCEPRLFAHYAQEPALLNAYNATPFRDIHHVVAELFSVERDPTAKRMNMGILTGMQVNSFAGHMDLPLNEARAMFNQWFEFFPGITEFQNDVNEIFGKRGWVRSILGRRMRLESRRFAYRGVSRVIQGSNADIIKERTLEVDKYVEAEWGDAVNIFLTIHDADAWQAEEGICDKATAEMVRIFCDVQKPPYNLRVPFKMDVGKGPNWSVATYGGKS